jgi:hypothetical protein
MKTYKMVIVHQETAIVFVEAENEEEARDIEWCGSWHGAKSEKDGWIESCEEAQPGDGDE